MGGGMYLTTVPRGLRVGDGLATPRERRYGELFCMDDLTHPTRWCSTMAKLTPSEDEEVDLTAVRTSTTAALVGPT